MKKTLAIIATCTILSMSCASIHIPSATPALVPTSTPSYYPDLSIRLETNGMGNLNVVQIDGYGNVSHVGMNFVGTIQRQDFTKITRQQVEELVTAMKEADLFNPKLRPDPSAPGALETSTIDLLITLNGQRMHIHHVQDWDCNSSHPVVPKAVCELEHRIETLGSLTLTPTP